MYSLESGVYLNTFADVRVGTTPPEAFMYPGHRPLEVNARTPRKRPTVTVCVPVYNGEQYLKAALDSILKQTYRDFELYILDNRSTDRTPQIARSYKDPRVRYLRNAKNLGSLGNWNRCPRTGSGAYVAIYHADDVYEPTILAREVAILDQHDDVCCVFTNSTSIEGKGRVIGQGKQPPHLIDRPLRFPEVYRFMLETFRSPYTAPTCIARRSAYRKAGSYSTNTTQAGDVDMYLRLTAVGGAYLISDRLLRYRHSDGQASIRYSTNYVKPNQLFKVIDKNRRFMKEPIPAHIWHIYEAYRDWDYTVCAINILAKPGCKRPARREARAYLRRSFTVRRVLRCYREPLLIGITLSMLLAAHTGWGSKLAKRVNDVRGFRLRRSLFYGLYRLAGLGSPPFGCSACRLLRCLRWCGFWVCLCISVSEYHGRAAAHDER